MENQGEKARSGPLPPWLGLSTLSISFKILQILHIYELYQFYLVMPTKIECDEPITSSFYRTS
jgi:hypothetical protein